MNQLIKLFLSLFVFLLSGCVDLSGVGHIPAKRSLEQKKALSKKTSSKVKPIRKGEVHTMLGGLGIFSRGMEQLRNIVEDRFEVPATTTMWYNAGNETREIMNYYYQHKNHRPIILIGHSLGANEQIKVARNLEKAGIPVDLLVTVDAVSQTRVPANVRYALNVYKPGYVPMFSGLKIKAVNPNATQVENLNVMTMPNVKVNHFTIDKDEVLQAIVLSKVDKVLRDGNYKKQV
jgi:hypothetical protein